MKDRTFRILLRLALSLSLFGVVHSQKKALTVHDLMAFKEIHGPVISDDGHWVAFETRPDRGDGEVTVRRIDSSATYTVSRGSGHRFSKDGSWLAVRVEVPFLEKEKRKNGKGNGPKPGMSLVKLSDGSVIEVSRVEGFEFSEDSQWLAYHRSKDEKKPEEKESKSEAAEDKDKKKARERTGRTLVLRHLTSGAETEIADVDFFSFDKRSRFVVYSLAVSKGEENGLYYRNLGRRLSDQKALEATARGRYTHLSWDEEGNRLGFLSSVDDDKGKPGPADLKIWDGSKLVSAVTTDQATPGWMIPAKNQLAWSRDGKRLFFGLRPEQEGEEESAEEADQEEARTEDIYDVEKILQKREVDVWHWMDDRINPEQKKVFNRLQESTYQAVYDLDSSEFVPLADEEMPDVWVSETGGTALGSSDIPYLRQTTWGETQRDVYSVDLKTGSRTRVADRLTDRRSVSASPSGRFTAFYKDKEWWLHDVEAGETRCLTDGLDTPFYNEDHDYPSSVPSYGIAGWVSDDSAVLIYDKYDIWEFRPEMAKSLNLTGRGRQDKTTFRVVRTDPKAVSIEPGQRLLLSGYHDLEKHYGFFEVTQGQGGLRPLLEGKNRFRFVAKAKDSDKILYTRESYSEFPDLWVADSSFSQPVKVSEVNPQVDEFAWGSAELVEWNSLDGIPLQGILIKPGNYIPGKRYPVLVYFYRFFSQRLHEFNQVVVNHRPCFPFYASNGYAVFLPDIRFEVGNPGFAATKSLVPGVQKLIDLGIADPEAVGLHGHSWSGYQTAFIVTQTDLFAAAVAGAPVSNMTSAYGGIRWASGKARQFQYEKTQSRIGGSLWENLQEYIENSPVFFADRINTPMLIQFGDEDGAVPWYQGIELYLALRRLDKDCVFLQYRGEPHHLQKYPNKLDYTIKMKEYFDHYLKGEPAPDWITKGVPYNGK